MFFPNTILLYDSSAHSEYASLKVIHLVLTQSFAKN